MIHGFRSLRLLFVAAIALVLVAFPVLAQAGHDGERAEKLGILLVAFGSSVPEAQVSFENIDQKVKKAYPGVPVYWAYTSHIIRNKLKKQGKTLYSPAQALADMADAGFTKVAVQSLHSIPGEEYNDLKNTVERFEGMPGGMEHIAIGAPLMYTSEDINAAADALLKQYPTKRKAKDAVVLMGHGTPHPANVYYTALQYVLSLKDANTFVGTVEGWPTIDDVAVKLKAGGFKNVWLMPFMSVAGDHARNDMAGDEADSWKSILTAQGFKVQTVLHGTAEYDNVVALWLAHLDAAFLTLK